MSDTDRMTSDREVVFTPWPFDADGNDLTEHQGVWRHPDEESVDLYPGLVVHDGRQSGSITTGRSRLPIWAFCWVAIAHGWEEAERSYEVSDYGWTAEKMGAFIHDLMQLRGEFGRLILELANAERWDREADEDSETPFPAWWVDSPEIRQRVVDQLRRCLACLESTGDGASASEGVL